MIPDAFVKHRPVTIASRTIKNVMNIFNEMARKESMLHDKNQDKSWNDVLQIILD
jgi:hypothetical protein